MKKILVISLAALLLIDGGLFLARYLLKSEPAVSIVTQPPASSAVTEPEKKLKELEGMQICIDAGHGITEKKGQEPIAPQASQTKPKHVSGAAGNQITEEELNLQLAMQLDQALQEEGATVQMTRTAASCDLSNVERAKLGNQSQLVIRIHADGNEDRDVNGISMLIPSGQYISDTKLLSSSRTLGEAILSQVIASTGSKNRGIIERSDLTGFNWSEVPVVLLEAGFITNPEEEAKLVTPEYQQQLVQGIVNGIKEYIIQQ
jgi:N-acetylmuramoyl-L-alanine amidase